MVRQRRLTLETRGHRHVQDLTDDVRRVVTESGITEGLVHVFNVGSTGVVTMLEFEQGLEGDLPEMLDRLIPPSRDYGHERAWHDGNGHSHLQASLVGPGLVVPVADGDCVLGTWQQIVHVECDVKPRRRTLVVTVYGDPAGPGPR